MRNPAGLSTYASRNRGGNCINICTRYQASNRSGLLRPARECRPSSLTPQRGQFRKFVSLQLIPDSLPCLCGSAYSAEARPTAGKTRVTYYRISARPPFLAQESQNPGGLMSLTGAGEPHSPSGSNRRNSEPKKEGKSKVTSASPLRSSCGRLLP